LHELWFCNKIKIQRTFIFSPEHLYNGPLTSSIMILLLGSQANKYCGKEKNNTWFSMLYSDQDIKICKNYHNNMDMSGRVSIL
jgi:hypothetical protein